MKTSVNIGLGNGLLPDSTKPLPEPILTYHESHSVTFMWWQFHRRYLSYWSSTNKLKFFFLNFIHIFQWPMIWISFKVLSGWWVNFFLNQRWHSFWPNRCIQGSHRLPWKKFNDVLRQKSQSYMIILHIMNMKKHSTKGRIWLPHMFKLTGLILGLRPANERWRYVVTTSLIGTAQTKNQPCSYYHVFWINK